MSKLSATSEVGGGFEFPFTQTDFQTIAGIVYEQSGIVLGAHKRDMTYAADTALACPGAHVFQGLLLALKQRGR